jgi:hypothetical protein
MLSSKDGSVEVVNTVRERRKQKETSRKLKKILSNLAVYGNITEEWVEWTSMIKF